MDTATALSMGTVIGGVIVFVARFMPFNKNGRVPKEFCDERHRHVDSRLADMQNNMKEIHADIREILNSINNLRRRGDER